MDCPERVCPNFWKSIVVTYAAPPDTNQFIMPFNRELYCKLTFRHSWQTVL
jgi:hypothetical protein